MAGSAEELMKLIRGGAKNGKASMEIEVEEEGTEGEEGEERNRHCLVRRHLPCLPPCLRRNPKRVRKCKAALMCSLVWAC